jgi:RNA polymerase sigma factor (sigma-70 family)
MTASQLTEWIDAHAAALTLFARQQCADPEAVVQDAFCKLARSRHDKIDSVAWLYHVVRNGAIDAGKAERRRRKRETQRAKPEVWFDETTVDADEAVQALAALPAELREVIVLRIWSGLTLEQIAFACDCSISSVHRRYEAGLQNLRERLGAPWPTN